MESNEALLSVLAHIGHLPPKTAEINEVVKSQKVRTDFWNIFWVMIKTVYPERVELYQGFTHVLPVLTLDEQVTREDLELFLSTIHHLTLIKAIIHVSSDGRCFVRIL